MKLFTKIARDMLPFALGVLFTQGIMVASGKDIYRAILVALISIALGIITMFLLRLFDKDK